MIGIFYLQIHWEIQREPEIFQKYFVSVKDVSFYSWIYIFFTVYSKCGNFGFYFLFFCSFNPPLPLHVYPQNLIRITCSSFKWTWLRPLLQEVKNWMKGVETNECWSIYWILLLQIPLKSFPSRTWRKTWFMVTTKSRKCWKRNSIDSESNCQEWCINNLFP